MKTIKLFEEFHNINESSKLKGKTLELFHGTEFDFKSFNLNNFNRGSGDGGWLGFGTYLTNDYEYAESYGDVLLCEFKPKKPYIITDEIYSKNPEKLAKELGVENSREISLKLIEEGYDCVILTYKESSLPDGIFIEVCVFEPKVIKIVRKIVDEEEIDDLKGY